MAKAVPFDTKKKVVEDLALAVVPDIQRLVPRYLSRPGTAERFVQVFLQEIPNNPYLLECEPRTLVGAFLTATSLGLEIGSALGHAYLVPYKGRVTLIIGYRGLVTLAERSGKVSGVEAAVVRAQDAFEFARGTKPFVMHKPKLLTVLPVSREAHERSLKAAYAVVTKKDGHKAFEVLSRLELLARRGRSQARKGPWYGTWQDFEAMCMKTPTRSLLKYTPLSAEVSRAVGLDEAGEDDRDQGHDNMVPDPSKLLAGPGDKEKRGKLDQVADELEKRKGRRGAAPVETVEDEDVSNNNDGDGEDI